MKSMFAKLTVALLIFSAFSAFAGGGKSSGYTNQSAAEMAEKLRAKGWIGIQAESIGKEWFSEITRVYANSPAEKAGFQVGDVLVAVNGIVLKEANSEKIHAMKKGMKVGAKSTYLVKRDGEKVKLTAVSIEIPEDVLATYIGKHVLKGLAAVAEN